MMQEPFIRNYYKCKERRVGNGEKMKPIFYNGPFSTMQSKNKET